MLAAAGMICLFDITAWQLCSSLFELSARAAMATCPPPPAQAHACAGLGLTCTIMICIVQCPNLRCVMSLGAGVDTLMAPGLIPQHLPIARIVSDTSCCC